jgi:hypothetical protein
VLATLLPPPFDFVLPSSMAVTEAEIKRLFRKFKKLDVDKSGQLTPSSELRSVKAKHLERNCFCAMNCEDPLQTGHKSTVLER